MIGLSLGDVDFYAFEVPSVVEMAEGNRIVAHHLGTGGTLYDAIGDTEKSISFSGVLSGPQALRKFWRVSAIRASKMPCLLRWGRSSYEVLVEHFRVEYEEDTWIPYHIRCICVETSIGNSEAADLVLLPEDWDEAVALLTTTGGQRRDLVHALDALDPSEATRLQRESLSKGLIGLFGATDDNLRRIAEDANQPDGLPSSSLAMIVSNLETLLGARGCWLWLASSNK